MEKDKNQTVTDGLYILQGSLNRIADALEEVLRLVKEDQERSKKYTTYSKNEDDFMGSENRIESE
jgi:hypothetical protein